VLHSQGQIRVFLSSLSLQLPVGSVGATQPDLQENPSIQLILNAWYIIKAIAANPIPHFTSNIPITIIIIAIIKFPKTDLNKYLK